MAGLTKSQSKDSKTVYRGPTAPVTSVAIGGHGNATVFGGCWDKDIWSWDRESRSPGRRYKGHSDFVKAIICARIGGKDACPPLRLIVFRIDLVVAPHLWWRRLENNRVGHRDWQSPAYTP